VKKRKLATEKVKYGGDAPTRLNLSSGAEKHEEEEGEKEKCERD